MRKIEYALEEVFESDYEIRHFAESDSDHYF